MTSENLLGASINTRQDAFQGVQGPPSASMSLFPTMYPIPGVSRPPLASLPNSTIPPSLSLDDYGAGGPSFALDQRSQSTIFPPANVTPSMFDDRFQEPFYHFAGMFPSHATTNLLPSEDSGHHQQFSPPTFHSGMLPSDTTTDFLPTEDGIHHQQFSPPTFQWPLPMQPAGIATRQQPQYQQFSPPTSQWSLPIQPAATATRQEVQYQQFSPPTFQWPLSMQPVATTTRQQAQYQQFFPPTSQLPFPMQPAATAPRQQAQYQAPLGGIAGVPVASATHWHAQDQVARVMQPRQEPGSVCSGDRQTNATFHEAPSAPEASLQGAQSENQPSVQPPVENTMWNSCQLEEASMNLVSLTV